MDVMQEYFHLAVFSSLEYVEWHKREFVLHECDQLGNWLE